MQIADLGLPHIPDSAIRNEIFKTLKHLPGKEELKFTFATENYYASLGIPIKLTKGWYKLDGYALSVTPFPEIELGIINGIDAKRIDKKLETVDWRGDDDIVSLASDNRSTFPEDIALLQEELFRLALSPEGKIVADQLMLRYWLCAPVFEDFISPGAMEMLMALPVKTHKFNSEITGKKAVNLLLGRPVLKDKPDNQGDACNWLRLIPSKKGLQELVTFPALPIKELQNLINLLPVDSSLKSGIEDDLINGEIAQTVSKSDRALYLKVTDTATGIQLFDHNKKEIPYNFYMDADWMPTQGQYGSLNQQPPDAKESEAKSKSRKKNYGRRL